MRENDSYQHTLELLEDSYVAADERGDLAGGSGSRGGLARWQRKRKVIAVAFNHDGTWLDVGCANGLLMRRCAGGSRTGMSRSSRTDWNFPARCATGAASP
jgi:hypothetical protein